MADRTGKCNSAELTQIAHFTLFMIRVILAPNDLLTLFDLTAQNFFEKMSESDLSARKKNFAGFFETAHSGSLVVEKYQKLFFRAEGFLSDNFF